MRRTIRLYIDGREADLSDDSLILYNYAHADLTDPAAVKNSYSQKVTLPATPANDAIFANFVRGDSFGGFDALRRTPFVLRDERSAVLQSGYIKLLSVTRDSYSVQMFGGLGGLFYALMYNADGSRKTLADISWDDDLDERTIGAASPIQVTPSQIKARWEALGTATPGAYSFAPMQNGIPEDFGADKLYYNPSMVNPLNPDVDVTRTVDGVVYSAKNAAGGVLVELGGEHTEWEVQDLRNYLQRPVWRVKAFFGAIVKASASLGITVTLDPTFFHANNDYYNRMWCTLPLLDRDKITSTGILFSDMMAGTESPADYLISLVKMLGLVFVYDEPGKSLTIMTRDKYWSAYKDSVLDITPIVDAPSVEVLPLLMEDKWQVFRQEVAGANGAAYEEAYKRPYGSLWIDTGYEFSDGETDVLDGLVFRSSADSLETSPQYRVFDTGAGTERYRVKFRATEEVKWKLYHKNGADVTSTDCEPLTEFLVSNVHYYDPASPFYDFFVKVQAHGSDGEAEDGSNILLFYTGDAETPKGRQTGRYWDAHFFLSEDNADMLDLNDGKPCWMLGGDVTGDNHVTSLPVFRRFIARFDSRSLELGSPKEVYVPGEEGTIRDAVSVTDAAWTAWMAERNDKEVRRMRCRVNLRTRLTPDVGVGLMRRFFWYDGALWVLNRIENHSVTTDDLTQCEFVRVIHKTAYTDGQDLG